MADVQLKIEGYDDYNDVLWNMSGPDLLRAERSAIRKGLQILKKAAKASMKSNINNVNRQNPKYNDKLIDAVRVSTVTEENGLIVGKAHTMGTRASGSGTYRARFFEVGTKDRWQKRKRKDGTSYMHYVGRIDPDKFGRFFSTAMQTAEPQANEAVKQGLADAIKRIWDKNYA